MAQWDDPKYAQLADLVGNLEFLVRDDGEASPANQIKRLIGLHFLTARLSPAQIVADQNDYNPAGLSTASVLRLSTDASRNLTGLAGGIKDRMLAIVNVGSYNLVLKKENAGSAAANRFALDGDLTLSANQACILWYDHDTDRWRCLSSGGSGGFWKMVPGSPTRVSDTQFTITDTGGAHNYASLFAKGVILIWDEAGTFQTAMIQDASYAADVVTINILGDSLTAGFTDMKYGAHQVQQDEFIVPGTLGTGTDVARTHWPECDIYKLAVDARVKAAGTTNSTDFDINDDGATIITTKPSIASGATSDLNNVCDSPSTPIAAGSALTLDIDAVSTTPPDEAYVMFYYYPTWWRYLS